MLKNINFKKILKFFIRSIFNKKSILLFFILFLSIISIPILYVLHLIEDLPDPDKLISRHPNETVKILDRNEQELFRFYSNEDREFINIDNVPSELKWSIIAAEDADFYKHKGVDFKGIIRCSLRYLLDKDSSLCGGSTLTQQLVRNTLLKEVYGDDVYNKTMERKLKEIILAIQVERTYSKEQILQMYINEVPLGGVNYGFQSASKAYFNKKIPDLSLSEATLLVGLLSSPSTFNPIFGTDPSAAYERQNYVLSQLSKYAEITGIDEESIQKARDEKLTFSISGATELKAPHFVFFVQKKVVDQIGLERFNQGGFTVNTTLDQNIQQIAEQTINSASEELKNSYGANNAGILVIEPSSNEIVAMVGSKDFYNKEDIKVNGEVNMTTAYRQAASIVKPYIYLKMFEKGYGPYTITPDLEEMDFGYPATNYDGKYNGIVNIREALSKSLNIPALYSFDLIGSSEYLEIIDRLKINIKQDQRDDGIVLALGSADMSLYDNVRAFSVFANEGMYSDLVSIKNIIDNNNEYIYKQPEKRYEEKFSKENIFLLNWILCDYGNFKDHFGQEYYEIDNKKLCGKTGTSDNSKDMYAILYHKNLVVGTWSGNTDGSPTSGSVSSRTSLPLAYSFLKNVQEIYPVEPLSRPDNLLDIEVCYDTGKLPNPSVPCSTIRSIYNTSLKSSIYSDLRHSIEVCVFNNQIPTNLDMARIHKQTKLITYLNFDLDNNKFQNAYNNNISKISSGNIINSVPETGLCLADSHQASKYTHGIPIIEITDPANGTVIKKGSVINFKANIDALHLNPGKIFNVTIALKGKTLNYYSQSPTPFLSFINTTIEIPQDIESGPAYLELWMRTDAIGYSEIIEVFIE